MSHTRIQVDLQRCTRCGGSLAELHTIMQNSSEGVTVLVGSLLMCRRCNPEAWVFRCRMPRTERAKVAERRVVL
jgi:uncharacterized protein with PIN domain